MIGALAVFAPCVIAGVGVPDPHERAPRGYALEDSGVDPADTAGSTAPCGGVFARRFEFAVGDPVGFVSFSAVVTAEMQDLNGDGVIQADAGFYGPYAGPSEVLNLTIEFYTENCCEDPALLASYQNITDSVIAYPYLYFEWLIGAPELDSWDLGADPGVFCFGGPAVTAVDGSYFWNRESPTEFGLFGWPTRAEPGDRLADGGEVVSEVQAGGFHGFAGTLSFFKRAFYDPDSSPNFELIIVDNADPENPREVATLPYLFEDVASVSIDGELMLVVTIEQFTYFESRFRLYDISDPSAPQQRGGFGLPFHSVSEVIGDHVYTGWIEFQVRGAGVEGTPLLGAAPTLYYDGFRGDVSEAGDHVYMNEAFGGPIRIFDVSDPSAPFEAGTMPSSEISAVVGSTLYVQDSDPLIDGVDVYDVSTPATPAYVRTLPLSSPARQFTVVGDRLDVLSGAEVLSFDVSDSSDPVLIMTTALPVSPGAAVLLGPYVAFSTPGGQQTIVSSSERAIEPTPGQAHDGTVVGGYAYVADGDQGLALLDVRDHTNPEYLSSMVLPGDAVDAASRGPFVFATYAGAASGVAAVDASSPWAPTVTGMVDLDEVGGMAADGDRVFVGAGSTEGYRVVAVGASRTGAPEILGEAAAIGDETCALAVADGVLYFAEGLGGDTVQVFDVADAWAPALLTAFQIGHAPTAVWAEGGVLYVLVTALSPSEPDVVYCYDVTVPTNPVQLSTLELAEFITDLDVRGGRLFALGGVSGEAIHAVDVSQPCSPRIVGVREGQVGQAAGGLFRTGAALLRGAGSAGVAVSEVASVFDGPDTDSNGVPDACEPVQNLTTGTGYASIQTALDGSVEGHSLMLDPGVYVADDLTLPAGVDLTFVGCGPTRTLINSGGESDPEPILDLRGTGQTTATLIEGMTLYNGVNSDAGGGGAVIMSDVSPVVRDVHFVNNSGPGGGSGVAHMYMRGTGTPVIDRCVFVGGSNAYDAVNAHGACAVEMRQCVIADNATFEAVRLDSLGNTVVNCTVVGDDTELGRAFLSVGGSIDMHNTVIVGFTVTFSGAQVDLSRCLAPGAPGDNVPGAPSFVDRPGRDFRLAPGSLGIDAADGDALDPAVMLDLGGLARYVDDTATSNTGIGSITYLDIGAYEYGGTPVAACPPDIDGNGVLNVDDIEAFVIAFLGGDLAADMDANGVLNVDDIEVFVEVFLAGCDE